MPSPPPVPQARAQGQGHAADADAVLTKLVEDGTFDALRRRLDAALASDPAVQARADALVAGASTAADDARRPGSASQPLAARPRADVVAAALAKGGAAAVLDDALAAAWRVLGPEGELGGGVVEAGGRGLGRVWDERDRAG